MEEARRKYDREFKEGAVRIVREAQKPIVEFARERGVLHASPQAAGCPGAAAGTSMGLRIGELVDLEFDCVHEVAGHGVWLMVALGKLATERMVPIDDEVLALVDELVELRSPGWPLPHPRDGRPTEFLLTHHGRRLSITTMRKELRRVAAEAGLGAITPHQLRHTYATAGGGPQP